MGERNFNTVLPDRAGIYECKLNNLDLGEVIVTRVNGEYLVTGDSVDCTLAELEGAYWYGPITKAINDAPVPVSDSLEDDVLAPGVLGESL